MLSWGQILKDIQEPILGIINITQDSFSGDGVLGNDIMLFKKFEYAKKRNIKILDIGCVSTKPGFQEVSLVEEQDRLYSFLINKSNDFIYSIDTMNSNIAKIAIDNNFSIINDVGGFLSREMIDLAIKTNANIILVHRNQESVTLHEKKQYNDVINQVKDEILIKVSELINLGIKKEQIAIDPGLGFGKEMKDSANILKNIEQFQVGYPLVVGYSNKKFLQFVELSSDEVYKHCKLSGVSLMRLHLND